MLRLTTSAPRAVPVSLASSRPSAADAATTRAGTRIQASTSVDGDLKLTARERYPAAVA